MTPDSPPTPNKASWTTSSRSRTERRAAEKLRRALATLLFGGLAAASFADAAEPGIPQADRLPWTRGSADFERSYLSLGPLPASHANGEALEAILAARPAPGDLPRWQRASSWTDVIDLGGLVAALPSHADEPGESVAFIRFNLRRERAGPAALAIGCDAPLSAWANGKALGAAAAPAGFAPDQHAFEAELRAGDNDVLLRLELAPRPCRLTLRALEPGALADRRGALWPSVDWSTLPARLRVWTSPDLDPEAAAARVEIVAPGGRIVGASTAERGRAADFDPAGWPDGPYEIRCVSENSWGEPVAARLPWFKGDAAAAARRRVAESARSSSEPAELVRAMLAEMLRDRLSPQPPASPALAAAALGAPLFELAELDLEASGDPTARVRPGGMIRLAWIDETDGSAQFCRAYLPRNYDPARASPAIVFLHGFNPENPPYTRWWGVDARHSELADAFDVIALEPHGRGNSQYLGIGEQDVLRALAEARRVVSIDPARIYITGESMGGSGAWILASRHNDIFAAAAPVFGGWEFRVAPPDGTAPLAARDYRQGFTLERRSSFAGIESLLDTPVYTVHGDNDFAASVENTRHAARLLQRWGYNVRYREAPGRGHEDLNAKLEIARWLLQHRLAEAPKRARLRSTDLLGAKSHWLQVEGIEAPARLIRADAEVVAPGMLRLDTENVAAATIRLPASLGGDGARLRVVWNGETLEAAIVDGAARVETEDWKREPRPKRPGLEGPVSDIIRTPFLVVVGTISSDPAMRQRCREKADAFRELWRNWQGAPPRVMDDVDVGSEEERTYSLILLGGPEANAVSRRMERHLPLNTSVSGVSIHGIHWSATDAVAEAIFPSPYHPDRYALIVAATSADGMYFWDPLLWNAPFGFPARFWDWRIVDGRLADAGDPLAPERSWVAAGHFDAGWRADARWSVAGDEALRAGALLRKAPPIGGLALDPAALDALCGRYELSPYVAAVVSRAGGGIQISIAGEEPIALVAESADVFAFAGSGAPIVFERDASGAARSLTLRSGGQTTVAQRTP